MDLQQWFYVLGIAYIVSWLLILAALLVTGVVAYRRYQKLKQEVKAQGAVFFATSSLLRRLPMKKLVPLIAALPLVTNVLKTIVGKGKRSKN